MKAAILEKIEAPLVVIDIPLPEKLERGQVTVHVLCTGICGSQLQEIDGVKGDPTHLPHLLGHEGCGIVEQIGPDVTKVKKGDKVVMHWRKGAGIDAGPAAYGTFKAGPITTFSEYATISENRVTAIQDDIPNDFAALLGCALSTALAVVENEARLKLGDSICVIGCGGLGLSIIFALTCRKTELFEVTGVDTSIHSKAFVERLGAEFSLDPCGLYDIIIDTVGIDPAKQHARRQYISLQKGGTSGGGFLPTVDIPRYCECFRHGTYQNYESLITHKIGLDQINDGIQLMREGKAGRVMIEM